MSDLLVRLDRSVIAAVAGHAPSKKAARQSAIIDAAASVLPQLMAEFSIDTELRIEHFLAQLGHESDSFCTTREYASGEAYEGRKDLGNTEKGDGVRFRGRGLIQLTGRSNYRSFTSWMRSFQTDAPNFVNSPDLVEEFPWAAWSAIWFWSVNSLNAFADRDDVIGVTKRINGGRNGLDDRQRRLEIAKRKIGVKAVIMPIAASVISAAQNDFVVLHRGIEGQEDRIEDLQRRLAALGFYHLAIDGEFGAATEQAVRAFQKAGALKVDGLVGAKTMAVLTAAEPRS